MSGGRAARGRGEADERQERGVWRAWRSPLRAATAKSVAWVWGVNSNPRRRMSRNERSARRAATVGAASASLAQAARSVLYVTVLGDAISSTAAAGSMRACAPPGRHVARDQHGMRPGRAGGRGGAPGEGAAVRELTFGLLGRHTIA